MFHSSCIFGLADFLLKSCLLVCKTQKESWYNPVNRQAWLVYDAVIHTGYVETEIFMERLMNK